ncbi:MAG: glucokinase [Gammaproteobacteria bacterium]
MIGAELAGPDSFSSDRSCSRQICLAGDVGGTKTILALFETDGDDVKCLKKEQFSSANYQTFTELLTSFLTDVDCMQVTAVCIGVAGIVLNGRCETTNLPWVLSCKEIGERVETQNVWLLNDLEATAWGLLSLPEHNLVELNPDAQPQQGNIAVVAAGTGLGEAIIAWDGATHHVIASEGGHVDFAPNSDQEIALLSYMREKHPEHVSCERLISGEGLVNIYQFLRQSQYAPTDPETEQRMTERDPAAVIGEAGITGVDVLCVEALKLFCRLYGSESGNLALKCLPYGGVYLAGGIGAKILPVLQQGDFLDGFLAKGRCRTLLQKISVKVCTNPEVALLGALNYTKNANLTL